jgi:hypothetical protein
MKRLREQILYFLIVLIILLVVTIVAIVTSLLTPIVAHSKSQTNTVSGIVYDSPNCNGIQNGVNGFSIAVYRDGQFWKFITTTLGGLYAINNLEDNVDYRFQFAKRGHGEVNATFRFPSGDNNVVFNVNRAHCDDLYFPIIQLGRPSRQ